MSTARKAHILRAKPPWREDLTRCGRNPEGLRLVVPGAGMRMQAAMVWKWRLVAAVSPQTVPPAVRQIERPEGLCSVCWLNLGEPRGRDWTADPLGVLGVTPDNREDAERLAGELRALACLAARHPAEFAGLLEAEQVLAALGRVPARAG
jgi:hypothetical protein